MDLPIDATTFLQIVGPIGFFLSIGFFLDRVFPRDETSGDASKDQENTISNMSEAAYQKLFVSFFGGRLLQPRYLIRVGSISLCIYFIVLIWQNLVGDQTLNFRSSHQVFVLFVCAAINVVVDVFSVRITQTFFWVIVNGKNFFNTIIAFFADLLLSINFFIYLSTALLFVFYTLTLEIFLDFKRSGGEVGYQIAKVVGPEEDTYRIRFYSSFEEEEDRDFRDHHSSTFRQKSFLNLSVATGTPLNPFEMNEVFGKIGFESLGLYGAEDELLIDADVQAHPDDSFTVSYGAIIETLAKLPTGEYSIRFEDVRIWSPRFDEYGVIVGIFEKLNSIEYSVFVPSEDTERFVSYLNMFSYDSLYRFRPILNDQICVWADGWPRIDSMENQEACQDGTANVQTGMLNGFLDDLVGRYSVIFDTYFPVFVMLLTTVWFSILMYICFVGIVLMQGSRRWLSDSVKPIFLRAPYSFTSLALGCCATALLNLS